MLLRMLRAAVCFATVIVIAGLALSQSRETGWRRAGEIAFGALLIALMIPYFISYFETIWR